MLLFESPWCHSADQVPTGPGSADPVLPYVALPHWNIEPLLQTFQYLRENENGCYLYYVAVC